MIFDANAFIGKWPYWPVASSSAHDVIDELHRYKIEKAAVCSTRSVFVNWEDGNRETEAAVVHGLAGSAYPGEPHRSPSRGPRGPRTGVEPSPAACAPVAP